MPTAKRTTTKKAAPAAKSPAVKKPVAKSPAVKKPAATPPAAKSPAVKKPVVTPPADTTPITDLPVSTLDEVKDYLTAPGSTIAEKLVRLSTDATGSVKSLAAMLVTFSEDMGTNTPEQEPRVVLGKLYNLYITIKDCVETKDQSEYMVKMDILNLAFLAYGEAQGALSSVMLLRYDYAWTWGEDALKTYQILVVVISSLANRATRTEQIKRVNLNNSFARTGIAISQEDVQRLISYYQ